MGSQFSGRLTTPGAAGCAAVLLCGLAACSEPPRPPANRFGIEHVVLISIDTLRADRLGSYGFSIEGHGSPSPGLDAFAAEGVVFTQHMSVAPTTLASHTSIMTGTYPHSHGIARNGYYVNDQNEMLAEVLSRSGFYTAGFIGAAPLEPGLNFDQGFLHFDNRYSERTSRMPSGYQRRAEEVTGAVLDWLDRRYGSDGSEHDENLLLFVHYFDVHSPWDAPEPYGGMYQPPGVEPPEGSRQSLTKAKKLLDVEGEVEEERESGFQAWLEGRASSAEGIAYAEALDAEYCAEITYTDHHITRLFDGLRERGMLDDALVVVTSDHGETMYEHSVLFSHGESVYDTELRTPLLLRFPGGRFAGTRIERLASGIDVMPSILDALSLPVPAGVEGESFLAALEGDAPPRGPIFAEATKPFRLERFHDDPRWPNRGKFQCVRTERWKYMYRLPDKRFRLYDLAADPGEQENLLLSADTSAQAEAARLKELLDGWRDAARPFESELVDLEDQIEALKSLGYIGGDDDR